MSRSPAHLDPGPVRSRVAAPDLRAAESLQRDADSGADRRGHAGHVRAGDRELAELAATAADAAERLLVNAKRTLHRALAKTERLRQRGRHDAAAGRGGGRLVRAVNDLTELLTAARKIVAQTLQRVAGITPELRGRSALLAWLDRLHTKGFWLVDDDVFGCDEHVWALSVMGARRDGIDTQTRVVIVFRYRDGRQV